MSFVLKKLLPPLQKIVSPFKEQLVAAAVFIVLIQAVQLLKYFSLKLVKTVVTHFLFT